MITRSILALLFLVAGIATAAPASEAKTEERVRLTNVEGFPQAYRDAVRAVIAALSADGSKPEEYFAEISPTGDSTLGFHLIHQSHNPDPHWVGDSCGKCRTTTYDTKSGKVSKIYGIR